MSDLRDILPRFPIAQYNTLLSVLEKHKLTTSDLLVLGTDEIVKRTKADHTALQRLSSNVLAALQKDLGVLPPSRQRQDAPQPEQPVSLHDHSQHVSRYDRGIATIQRTGTVTDPTPGPLNQLPISRFVSTLSPALDEALGGGIPSGYLTEVTGESGVGKTQFLLSLLLAVQLPPPYGLGRPAIYVSTETPLATTRLEQILSHNPMLREIRKSQWADGTFLSDLDVGGNRAEDKANVEKTLPDGVGPLIYPSLDGVLSTNTPDLESQEHILTYQVPVEIARRNVGLLVIDSVAANYRAEFKGRRHIAGGHNDKDGASNSSNPQDMGARSSELIKLGFLLRTLAQKHQMAVVVSNQVSDRFSEKRLMVPSSFPNTGIIKGTAGPRRFPESPLASRSRGPTTPLHQHTPVHTSSPLLVSMPPKSSIDTLPASEAAGVGESTPGSSSTASSTGLYNPWSEQLHLDRQQCFFTGWGDDPSPFNYPSKTPSLGVVWATQVACRIALIKLPNHNCQPRNSLQPGFRHVSNTVPSGNVNTRAEMGNLSSTRTADRAQLPHSPTGPNSSSESGEEYIWERDEDGIPIPGSGRFWRPTPTPTRKTWRRWMKVVYAPHTPATGLGLHGAVEYDVTMGGLSKCEKKRGSKSRDSQNIQLPPPQHIQDFGASEAHGRKENVDKNKKGI